jgi:hypothetical protein
MIERTMVSGRPATVAYIKRDFTPADKDTWELAKVIFDDGEMVLLAVPDQRPDTVPDAIAKLTASN